MKELGYEDIHFNFARISKVGYQTNYFIMYAYQFMKLATALKRFYIEFKDYNVKMAPLVKLPLEENRDYLGSLFIYAIEFN